MGRGGSNDEIRKQARGSAKLVEERRAWVRCVFGEFIIYDQSMTTDPDPEAGERIQLTYRDGRKYSRWNLTTLTTEELDAVKKLFDMAFDLARPICEERDKEAQHAFENGDNSFARIYRQSPLFVDRSRPIGEHSPSLRNGPAGVPGLDSEPGDDGGLRRAGDDVAEPLPHDVGSQDDGAQTDGAEVVRPLGEVAD